MEQAPGDQFQVLMKIHTEGEIRSLIDTKEVALEFTHQLALALTMLVWLGRS